MSKTYYCHEDFPRGLTCVNNIDGKCMGSFWCTCSHKSLTPKYNGTPMPAINVIHKRTSSDCAFCAHKKVCGLKEQFEQHKERLYPVACECVNYKEN